MYEARIPDQRLTEGFSCNLPESSAKQSAGVITCTLSHSYRECIMQFSAITWFSWFLLASIECDHLQEATNQPRKLILLQYFQK